MLIELTLAIKRALDLVVLRLNKFLPPAPDAIIRIAVKICSIEIAFISKHNDVTE